MFEFLKAYRRRRLEKSLTKEFKEYLDYIEWLAKDSTVPLGVIESHRRAAKHIAEVLKLDDSSKKD